MSGPSISVAEQRRAIKPYREKVLDLLREVGLPRSRAEIAEALGTRPENLCHALSLLIAEGAIIRVGMRRYALAPLPTDDAERIAAITKRLADLRLERIRAASRLASQLYVTVGPLNDPRLFSLIDRLQVRLAERLPGEIEDGVG